jgi:putative phosphoserine phosphatase/1-acylglycerol-3-phosphate O-acyltransferase
MDKFFSFTDGCPVEKFDTLVDESFHEYMKPKIFKSSYDIIKYHKDRDDKIYFISNSIQPIVNVFLKHFDINDGYGTNLAIKGGKYVGKIDGRIMYGYEKKALVEKSFSGGGNKYFYTDHYSDLPLLEYVDNKVVVNPDRKLLMKAKNKNWKILKFKL